MFELLFPIFCFGVVVTGIVLKGLLLASEEYEQQSDLQFDAGDQKILHAFRPGDYASRETDRSTSASIPRRSL